MQEENKKQSIPVVDFSNLDSLEGSDILRYAKDSFMKSGCLLVRGAFDGNYIKELHELYCKEYASYFEDREYPDALTVGDKRRQVTLAIDGLFNAPRFYANDKLMPLLQSLLGENMIVGSVGSVVSSPGARDQHIHVDHPNIYELDVGYLKGDRDFTIPVLPPYAITAVIPLVRIDEVSGCTRSWPGSHLMRLWEINQTITDPHNRVSGVDFTAEIGDCYFMDYRLLHAGMANKSTKHRPIIYNVYYRAWFRDAINYDKQSPITLSDENYAKVPPSFRKLFSWSKPGSQVSDVDALFNNTNQAVGRNDPCFCGSELRYKHCHGKLN